MLQEKDKKRWGFWSTNWNVPTDSRTQCLQSWVLTLGKTRTT